MRPPTSIDRSGHVISALSKAGVFVWRLTTYDARQIAHRYVAHLAVLAIAILVMALGRLSLPESGALASPSDSALLSHNVLSLSEATLSASATPTLPARAVGGARLSYTLHAPAKAELVQRRAQPHTEVPFRQRLEVITYTVQPGDTTQGIALTFGLQDTTVMWCNPAIEDMPDYLKIGQQVVIPPLDCVCHTVKEGDTLEAIAEKYKVETSAITGVSLNALPGPDYSLEPSQRLLVENGTKPYVPKLVTTYSGPVPEGAHGTGLFQWPTTGYITQGYWWGHRAIDIGAPTGNPIRAADSGFVSFAGWTDVGYGYLIVVDHANGYATYYAHCSGIYVSVGQAVERGQQIGAVGSTGNSSGPHVHFEIRTAGGLLDPRWYLP